MTAEQANKDREAFRSMMKSMAKDSWRPNYIVEVISVDWNKKTCEVKCDTGESWPDARLRSVTNDDTNYVCMKPTVGSLVLIEMIEAVDTQVVVTEYSDVEEIDIVIGQSTYNIKDGKISMNGGNNGGLVIIGKLKDNFNAVKTYLNGMIQAIGAGFAAVGVGTAASGPNGKIAFNSAMASQTLNFEDMENTKIVH